MKQGNVTFESGTERTNWHNVHCCNGCYTNRSTKAEQPSLVVATARWGGTRIWDREIENSFAQLKDWRRVVARHDRCPEVYPWACMLAATVIYWLKLVLNLRTAVSGSAFLSFTALSWGFICLGTIENSHFFLVQFFTHSIEVCRKQTDFIVQLRFLYN